MQAGGHNPFANRFGMQVDNVVEIEVVTADGKFQKVSECNNPELFWALRGGGGGTFGVVTAATIKVYPTFPVVVSRFMVNTTTPYDPRGFEATAHFLQQGAKLRDQYGLMGYFYVYPNGFQSALHMPAEYATLKNAKAVTTKIMGEMEKIAGGPHIEPKYYEYKTYRDWYVAEYGDEDMEDAGKHFLSWYDGSWGDCPSGAEVMMNPMLAIPYKLRESQIEAAQQAAAAKKPKMVKRDVSAAGKTHTVLRTQPMARTYLDSRLLSDKMVNSIPIKQLADAVNGTFPRLFANHIRGFLYGGGKMAEPRTDAMGLLPAWRQATYHFIINAGPGSSRHDYNIRVWDKYFPESGAYINEAAPGEPKWKEKFWGTNYARLEQIKKKVDPKNVFWCSPCVGADMLSYDDERICKNPAYPQKGESPQTYANPKSKVGIASLPGEEGIPNPLMPIIQGFMANKTVPSKMPASNFFKMAMGQGGSSGGKWSLGQPKGAAAKQAGGMEGMDMGHGHM
jgi:FAD/FMN-containing dehydrogenase